MTTTQKKYIAFWASIAIGYVMPFIILGVKFDLFKKYTSVENKWSFWLVIGFVLIIFKLWKVLREAVDGMNEGLLREGLLTLFEIGPYALLLVSAFLINVYAQNYVYIARTIGYSFLASLPFVVAHKYYVRKYKLARGDVRVLK